MSGDPPEAPPEAPVAISQQLMAQVFAEARAAFPDECCGWLIGPRGEARVTDIRPCANAQATARSTSDSAAVPDRSAESAYTIAGPDLLALNHGLDSATPPRIIFHSHPNGKAYFSATDQRVARSPWGDGPAYPVQHLVVGIDESRVTEAALFAWSNAAAEYVEIARFAGES